MGRGDRLPAFPYRFVVRPLTPEEGGGYLVEFSDLPGCMADGDTLEEALRNAGDAMRCRQDDGSSKDRK